MSDWSDVRKGWVVEDKTGGHWTVVKVAGPEITISMPGRRDHTAVRSGPVTVVSRPAPQADPDVDRVVAIGLVATKFGGVEVGKQGKDKRKPWVCPVEYVEPGSMLAHLRIFHGVTSDEPRLDGLAREHAALHRPEHKASDMFEPHVHDPDYEEL